MSERGSFITQYIYCNKCFEAVKDVLVSDDKFLKGIIIPSWTGNDELLFPIIGGKIGADYSGEEADIFELELIPKIQQKMCKDHYLKIAVICDNGTDKVFEFGNTLIITK